MAKASNSGDLNGFLDANSKIEGELRFENTLRVDGFLRGKTRSGGALVVGEEGRVEGEIRVKDLFVSGTVRGSVRATGRVEIASGARVEADVDTPVLVVEEGAHFSGGCSMGTRSEDKVAETSSAGSPDKAPSPVVKNQDLGASGPGGGIPRPGSPQPDTA
ncbi:MAG: polymer-forming cytoskeletal protein [Acidobacteriota bacterium]